MRLKAADRYHSPLLETTKGHKIVASNIHSTSNAPLTVNWFQVDSFLYKPGETVVTQG